MLLEIEFSIRDNPPREALALSERFHSIDDSNANVRKIFADRSEILDHIDDLEKLWGFIGNRSSTVARMNESTIDYRAFFSRIQILRCSLKRSSSTQNGQYCFLEDGREGWGCHHLKSPSRYVPPFHRRDLHDAWYRYGTFSENRIWSLDRDRLRTVLEKDWESKGLELCEYFNPSRIDQILESLPGQIDPSKDPSWKTTEVRRIGNGDMQSMTLRLEPEYWNDSGELNHPETDPGRGGIGHMGGENREDQTEDGIRNIPETRFDEIAGLDRIVDRIREILELPLARPGLLKHFGIRPHRGVLLYGPPGCGKTLLARAVAHEVQAHFILVNGPELLSKWHGESEENLRKIFEEAREKSPSIIFFDEFDALASVRSNHTGGYESKMVHQLLTLMDGVELYSQISVVAATNRKDSLDPALLRPGRFDSLLEVGPPDESAILDILKISTRKMPLAGGLDLEEFVAPLVGKSGAQVDYIAREAAYQALRRSVGLQEALLEPDREDYDYRIETDDFREALKQSGY